MYEIRRYVDANALGGATLLDILANEKHTVRKLVVASSMSIYGEGAYHCSRCGDQDPRLRSEAQLRRHEWETTCPRCGERMTPRPTTEDKRLFPTSIYAVTKRDHEEMFLCVGRAYGIPTVALRYFNIYGPRQALSNPYTGVVAIFASRILNGHPPLVFEDGLQTRDFVHVSDIVRANVMALESEKAADQVFNVGTGRATSMLDLARHLSDALGYSGKPEIVNRYRAGDIRHCYADIGSIRTTLGFEPGVTIEDGLRGLTGWLRGESARDDVEKAREEMAQRGLLA
jgi:dTDP-L-rhamnose 4-epimerase